MTPPNVAAPVLQLALFPLDGFAGKRGCLFPDWLAKRLLRKPRRGTCPGLPDAQLRLEPCKAALDVLVSLRRMRVGDALVNGHERIEYVRLVGGGYDQVRWVRNGRIVGVGVIRSGDTLEKIRQLLASVLFAQGWQPGTCQLVKDAAYYRRKLRRALATC